MNSNSKLYVVVDSTLAPGLQFAQGMHAVDEFRDKHVAEYQTWRRVSNTIAVLGATPAQIAKIIEKSVMLGAKAAWFREPDLDDRVTCVVVEPGDDGAYLCKGLPLALT